MSAKPLLRLVYWATWFFVVPVILAGLTVWLVSPGDATAAVGPFRLLRSMVQDQPVPVAIVLFTIFEMVLWSQRHVLPLAALVGVGGRHDIPVAARKRFEQAQGLLDEAGRLQRRHHKDFERAVPAAERQALEDRLGALREIMEAERFERPRFEEAFAKAEESVDATLSRWRKGELREYGESIFIAVIVALLLRAFVVEAFKIPSRSMVPTLEVGDHIFVNKFAYGPMIPFTHSRLFSRLPRRAAPSSSSSSPNSPSRTSSNASSALPATGSRPSTAGRASTGGWFHIARWASSLISKARANSHGTPGTCTSNTSASKPT